MGDVDLGHRRRVPRVTDRFADRADAGRQLADAVEDLTLGDPVVLGLPRGGVPLAYAVAERLHSPLDVLVVRKLGAPHQRELAIGALAEDGETLIDAAAARAVGADQHDLDEVVARERREVERSVATFRDGRPVLGLRARDVVVVDDGLATGLTAEAAIRFALRRRPRSLTLAVPVGAPDSADRLRYLVDDVVCLLSPAPFLAVGVWYGRFDQTSDEEVLGLLARARTWRWPTEES